MSEKSYFVRTCFRNMEGKLISPCIDAMGFIWPEEVGSVVTCPDWDPTSTCGHGLHGLRPGDQRPGVWAEGFRVVWMVCSYDPETAVVLEGKVKVPSCVVEYVVDETDGAHMLIPLWLKDHSVTEPIYHGILFGPCANVEVGDEGYAIVSNNYTATAGLNGTAIANSYRGQAIAGRFGTAIAGRFGKAISGYGGSSTADPYGTAISGEAGTAIAGYCGYAQAGSLAIVGYNGSAIAGPGGVAQAGYAGKAQAGIGGTIQIQWSDGDRNRVSVGYIGENGLEPDTLYRLDRQGNFVKSESTTPHV